MGKGGVVGAVVAWCRQRRRSLIRGLYSSSDSSASKSTTAGSGCAKDGPGAGLEAVPPSGSEAALLGEAGIELEKDAQACNSLGQGISEREGQ